MSYRKQYPRTMPSILLGGFVIRLFELRREKASVRRSEIVVGLANIKGISILGLLLREFRVGEKGHFCASAYTSWRRYLKAQHLMGLATKFRPPIVAFVTFPGSLPGIEVGGSFKSIAITQHVFSQWRIDG